MTDGCFNGLRPPRMPRHAAPLPFEGRGRGWGIAARNNGMTINDICEPHPQLPLQGEGSRAHKIVNTIFIRGEQTSLIVV